MWLSLIHKTPQHMNKIDKFIEEYDPSEIKSYISEMVAQSDVDFHAIIHEAHEITLEQARGKSLHYIPKNWMAETMYGNMIGLFRDRHPELMFIDKHKRPYLRLSNNIRVYFKKMDAKYKPGNVVTKHVVDLWAQNSGGIGTKIHTFYIGYKIPNDKDWGMLIGVFGAYPNSFFKKKIDWVIDLGNYAKGIGVVPIAPIADSPVSNDFELKPKQKEKGGEI